MSNGSMMASSADVCDGRRTTLLQPGTVHKSGGVDVHLQRATVEARNALEDAFVAAAVAALRAITYAEMLDETLAVLHETTSSAPERQAAHAAPRFAEILSPREREVLTLVAEGRSNMAIVEALFVSPNTIKPHVASLLNKLRADSRVQLAAMATQQGPQRVAPR
jgi:DNA-binding NarL/FixJ family response regulator